MSDFKFNCPKCGQNIVCDTSNAGMQIPCPACQSALTVPTPAAAPAVPATPAKLSIKKTAHAPAPSPAAAGASAPAQPPRGIRPPAPASAGKKSPLVLVSVITVVLLVLAVGWFGFGAPYLQKQAEEKKQAEEEKARQVEAEKAKAVAAAAKARRAQADWSLDLTDTKFPERAASGKLHGGDFKVEAAAFQNGYLILRQTTGSPCQFQIGVPLKTGDKLADKTFTITSTDTANVPRVAMNWKEDSQKPPGVQVFNKGYAMKLEFGEVAEGQESGRIYLCVPDDAQSYVAGNFELGPKKDAAQKPKRTPRPPRKQPPGTQPPPPQ